MHWVNASAYGMCVAAVWQAGVGHQVVGFNSNSANAYEGTFYSRSRQHLLFVFIMLTIHNHLGDLQQVHAPCHRAC